MELVKTMSREKIVITGGSLVALLTLSHTLTDAVTGSFSALLPTLQSRFNLKETTLALLVAALSFSNNMMQPVFGAIADRFGRHTVGAAGMILNAIVLSLVGTVSGAPQLFGLLLIGGLGSAAFHPAVAAIAREAGGKRQTLAVSIFSAGGTAGLALGPIVLLLLVSTLGIEFMPWLMVPGFLVGLVLYRIVPVEAAPAKEGNDRSLNLRLLAGPVGLLSLTAILSSIPFVVFTSAIPLWLVKTKGLSTDDSLIAWTLFAFISAETLGGILGGALSRSIDRKLIVGGSMLLALLPLMGVLSTAPGSLPYFAAVMLAGALLNAGFPVMIVSAQDLAPQAVGAVSGFMMGFPMGIAALVYIGIGRIQESMGIETALRLSYMALIPAALLAFYTLGKSRRTEAKLERRSLSNADCPCSI